MKDARRMVAALMVTGMSVALAPAISTSPSSGAESHDTTTTSSSSTSTTTPATTTTTSTATSTTTSTTTTTPSTTTTTGATTTSAVAPATSGASPATSSTTTAPSSTTTGLVREDPTGPAGSTDREARRRAGSSSTASYSEPGGEARRKAPAPEPQIAVGPPANLGSLLQEDRARVVTAAPERGRLSKRPWVALALALGSVAGLLLGLADRRSALSAD